MNTRLKKLRRELDLTQQEFANRIKVKRNTVATYEMGKSTPSDAAVSLICREFNVNEEWLRHGNGPMFVEQSKKQALDAFVGDLIKEPESFRTRLIEGLAKLSPKDWDDIKRVLDDLTSVKGAEPYKGEVPTRIISYYQKIASAGKGEYVFDGIPTDTIRVEDTLLARKADFALGVIGDSMEPTYHDGDKVLVEKADEVEVGEVGIFFIENDCFIKEFSTNGLISHNPRYGVIPASEKIVCIGRVLGKAVEVHRM